MTLAMALEDDLVADVHTQPRGAVDGLPYAAVLIQSRTQRPPSA